MLHTLIKNNWFIAICAGFQALASTLIFQGEAAASLFFPIALLLSTKTAYTILRNSDIFPHAELRNHIQWKEFPWLMIAIVLLVVDQPNISQILVLVGSGLFTFLYGMHVFFVNKRKSIRSSPYAKVIVISLVWVLATVVYPMLGGSTALSQTQLLYIVMQFLFVMALTIPFDIHDHQVQKSLGFHTLVSQFGLPTVRQICRGLIILTWIISGFLGFWPLMTMSVLSVIYLRWLTMSDETTSFEQYTLRFDGALLIQSVILIALHLFDKIPL